jgi:hypothetical protein
MLKVRKKESTLRNQDKAEVKEEWEVTFHFSESGEGILLGIE